MFFSNLWDNSCIDAQLHLKIVIVLELGTLEEQWSTSFFEGKKTSGKEYSQGSASCITVRNVCPIKQSIIGPRIFWRANIVDEEQSGSIQIATEETAWKCEEIIIAGRCLITESIATQ